MSAITITEAAHDYLAGLLEKQNTPGIGIRVFITQVIMVLHQFYFQLGIIINKDKNILNGFFTLICRKNNIPTDMKLFGVKFSQGRDLVIHGDNITVAKFH